MGQFEFAGRLLDARPDRVDFRDRPYLPPLRPLPPEYPLREDINRYFEEYARTYVLNQFSEGACTGFGLAAMINFLYWRHSTAGEALPARVSPRMLYELARLYDEWDGEDYDGSSCRGAMKGWHKHGVCDEALWPYGKRFIPPKDGWANDATERPLGAYYRVDAKSLNDMQAAIRECGAVYASARIHAGWFDIGRVETIEAAVIARRTGEFVGGHAFALVGYDRRGFIVQNSWGTDWGYGGFARLSYADWVEGGFDAWVAAAGAPVFVDQSVVAYSPVSLQDRASATAHTVAASTAARPLWDNATCYQHAVVLGNDGTPMRRLPECRDGAANLEYVLKTKVEQAYKQGTKTLVLYLHGGLNSEQAGIVRASVLGPAFARNGLHPVFVVWRTGFGETILNILQDLLPLQQERVEWSVREIGKSMLDWLDDQKDNSLELAARVGGGKAVWTEMKENAAYSAESKGGMRQVASILGGLAADCPELTIHVVAHSAGAILFGHLLKRLGRASGIKITTTTLFAPAATVDFAVDSYGPAFKAGVMPKASMLVHFLDDRIEKNDTVGPYGKSLLYLVCRAFEREHKTPLLGLQLAWKAWWDKALKEDTFHKDFDPRKKASPLVKWQALVDKHGVAFASLAADQVDTAPGRKIDAAHGSFDNDVAVINDTLRRIIGKDPAHPVTDLSGF
ncbi:papain like protease [Rhizobium subbaraonis]|uniref:Papain like protease n=1 Tax=Rhizobium subbaraonis TaxID=908946 RepID=A0A285U0K8_9HYPH|nr:C1 family peptidase [Rhizobium subbaraonis]SOC35464.1 papain like protease [Rhizobium subbaraonis]